MDIAQMSKQESTLRTTLTELEAKSASITVDASKQQQLEANLARDEAVCLTFI